MKLDAGGHLTHGHAVNASGKLYNFVSYGVERESEIIDYEEMLAVAKEHQPKVIVVGATAYPRQIDFKRAREIADEVDAILMADMAHIAGLVAGGAHPSPAGLAQVITTSTHKTLRGPRGGMILCDSNFRRRVDRGVFPGHQGGPMMHVIAGKAVMAKEAATSEFKAYSEQTVENARTIGAVLSDAGLRVISGGTDNHLILLDVTPVDLDGQRAADALERAGIVVNKNAIPFDELPPMTGSGIRFGTPAITSRGLGTSECQRIGEMIAEVLSAPEDEAVAERVKAEIKELCDRFPAPGVPTA